jgi:hypothetical protein
MEESKLSELLRDAVADAPPPTFDQHDVARESERQRTRVRNGILTGSALGVALLAGATALSVALWTGSNSAEQSNAAASDSAGGNANTAPYELDDEGRAAAPRTDGGEGGGDTNSSPESRKQGRASDEEAGPAGPGSTPSGCEQADRELAAALAGELPAAALPDTPDCEPGLTSVTFTLPDGVITVMLLDQGTMLGATDQTGQVTEQAEASTEDGRTVVIYSGTSSPGTPPYSGELDDLARRVAARF